MTGTTTPASRLAWVLLAGCGLLCAVIASVYLQLSDRDVERRLAERADLVAAVLAGTEADTPASALLARALDLPVDVAAAELLHGDSGRRLAVTGAAAAPAAGVRWFERPLPARGWTLRVALTEPDRGHASLGAFAFTALTAMLAFAGAAAAGLARFVLDPMARRAEGQQAELRRSEERLQLAVAGSNDALFDYDPARRKLFLSDVFRRWFGGEGGTGAHVRVDIDNVMSRIHPAHAPRVYRALQACSETGRPFDEEFQIAKPDGSYLWLQLRGRGVAQDDHFRISGFASNISRRKLAETLLQDSVERLGAVLDNIAEGIVTLDGDGRLCTVNAAARQMFGEDVDDLVGRSLSTLIDSDAGADWAALADRQPREARLARPAGADPAGDCPVEFAVSTMDIRSDERFIVVIRDVSERKQAEGRLRAAIAESEAATRAKDEFLATMSHEIRTPMNGVLGMTQLLMDMDLTPQQRETAQLIRNSGESLLTIINDILDFSRAGSGRLKVDATPFDLRVAIRDVVDLLGRRRNPVDVYIDYPLALPSRLVGDQGRVRQVLMNLVGNALKFTERGHVLVSVSGEVLPGTPGDGPRARLQIAVEDTGPGIDAGARSQLFEPFTQADASTTRRFGGTGLGLAISRRLVELMGGEIGLDSEPGVGSTFRFSLELPCADVGPAPQAPPQLAGRRLLLVDDNARGRDVLAGYLRGAGMTVVTAGSGPEALTELEGGSFDMALIDDQMPNMDGLLLCELIRIDSTWADVKLVLMCAADFRGVDESRAVDRCLVRPLMPDQLLRDLAMTLDAAPAASAGRRDPPAAAGLGGGDGAQAAGPRPAPERRGPAPYGGGARRVLLAEDNAINQKVAVRMLEKLGYRIDVAADGEEAVDLWRHFDYAAVVMDCQMPRLDGLEASRRIRDLEREQGRPRTPIIAMTANAMHQDRSDCLAAGMDDYLAKPVRQDDLAATLGRWLPAEPVQKIASVGGDASA